VEDPSEPAVTEFLNEVTRAHEYAPARKPKCTGSWEVLQAVRELNAGKALGQKVFRTGF
jgi:hypothetical protein